MKLSLRNKILLFAVIPILAIFLCYVGIKDINGGKNAIDIADLTVEDIKKGTYVKGNIPYLLDSFAYEETTEKHAFSEKKETTKYYYIMPLVNTDEVKYVAVCCDVDNVDNYNKLCEETIAYLTNASAPEPTTQIAFKGEIKELSDDERQLFREYFSDAEFSEKEIDDLTIEMLINEYDYSIGKFFLIIGGVVGGVWLIIMAITFIALKKHSA